VDCLQPKAAFHNEKLSFPERNPSGQHGLLTFSAIKRLQIDIDVMMVSSCLKRALDVSTSLIRNLWQPAVLNHIRSEQAINDLKSNRRFPSKLAIKYQIKKNLSFYSFSTFCESDRRFKERNRSYRKVGSLIFFFFFFFFPLRLFLKKKSYLFF